MFLLNRDCIKDKKLLIASSFVGIVYMHYAFSRADIGHLAHSIEPFLIAIFSLFFISNRKVTRNISLCLIIFVSCMSFFTAGRTNPIYTKADVASGVMIQVNIKGNEIWSDQSTANVINVVKKLNTDFIKPEDQILIAPYWPGFYPILNKKSPLPETYFIFKEKESRQLEMIDSLKKNKVKWVIMGDVTLDCRVDLGFKNTHTLVWQYIMNNYTPISVKGLPDNYKFMHIVNNK